HLHAVVYALGEVDLRHAALAYFAQCAVARNFSRIALHGCADPAHVKRNRTREIRARARTFLAPRFLLPQGIVDRALETLAGEAGLALKVRRAGFHGPDGDVR